MNENLEAKYAKLLKAKKEQKEKELKFKKEIKKINKKQRDHALILKGTVFERLDLLDESEEYLTGLLISAEPFNKTQEQKEKYAELGAKYLRLRKLELLKKGDENGK